jgi:hypothetical protein
MRSKCAIAVLLFCLSGLQRSRADTIPVTMSPNDASDANVLAGIGNDPDWTTPGNNELLGNLLGLITALGGNSADIAELYQPGAVFASDVPVSGISLVTPVVTSAITPGVPSGEQVSNVPEPVTMGLLGGALLFLIGYARRRLRKINLHHGPLQRSD